MTGVQTCALPISLASRPASVRVRVVSAAKGVNDESLAVNFNLPASQSHHLKGHDLVVALQGLGEQWGPSNGAKMPLGLGGYRFVNEAGEIIAPQRPLFAQLGTGQEVLLLPPGVPLVNDQTN